MMNPVTKVVVAAPSFLSPIYTAMAEHLKKLFKPEEIVLKSVTDDPATQKGRLEHVLVQTKPSALIAMDIRLDSGTVTAYTSANIPIVLIGEKADGVSKIMIDNVAGGRLAGEYLIGKGRKQIAIVSGRTKVKGGFNAEQRLKGFQQALSAKGIPLQPGCTIEVPNYSREDGLEVMPKLLDLGVDAIFCAAGDNCALGLLSIARENGVRVPDDVAIVGFDDLFIAQVSSPPLTTIKQPLYEMAYAAYTMTVKNRDEILRRPQEATFNPEIVVRQSA
jgi:LacI family transcriptional regulator